jgi:hypothetical protein
MPYIDYERLEAIDPSEYQRQKPFPWANPQGILRPEALAVLCENLPDFSLFDQHFGVTRKAGQLPHDRYTLEYTSDLPVPAPWKALIQELIGKRYRRDMCRLMGVRRMELNFHWHLAPDACSVSPHCDSGRKLGSHLFYLNTERDWDPAWGGQTVVLDDGGRLPHHSAPSFEDFDVAVPAEIIGNRSFIFTRTPHSWHGVRAIHCPEGHMRKLFIVVMNRADPIHRLRAKLFGKGFERF